MAKYDTANKPYDKYWIYWSGWGIVIKLIKDKSCSINKGFCIVIEKLEYKCYCVIYRYYKSSIWSGKFEGKMNKESRNHNNSYMR